MPNVSVYCLGAATILEGVMFAIYSTSIAGISAGHFGVTGFFTRDTMLQTLRFASITFLSFHRCLRPANRIDPMRTVLELEVVSVCWDALDGSTLYQLLDEQQLALPVATATRVLMAFWYTTVGVRIAAMFGTHLPPDSRAYQVGQPTSLC